MNFLAISGSARATSTNTAMLNAVSDIAAPDHTVTVFSGVADLPVFSPDFEGGALPATVEAFAKMIRDSDGLIIASPEYVRAIPGGLKNAIDWLVSRDEIIVKPIVLLHASHRGDDMLAQLRLVLATVSGRFMPDLFLRFSLMNLSARDIAQTLQDPTFAQQIKAFLNDFETRCASQYT
ncbi:MULTISPECIES: NADPH-dependent FMN reductase [Pacificibacter]|uniref:NADPH-dependent FMN reductase n=1 Tax=Pacificibacter TaxID=1042323 RepID=UPI001C082B94|nr:MULTISPECIES: NADPH-dependent FMN reductase [Pacificibacter]MBU2936692.1 NAD(P)H-dependent oxidoreductase [Pacificibacter marinus]MDO6614506.1 NADPH-dependent FMN reductase [Pacificibacter sp. 1_MG-2023]